VFLCIFADRQNMPF